MERNGNAAPPESPPAAAPSAANDTHPGSARAEPAASLPALSPAAEAEDAAYWRGYHAALAAASQPAADEAGSPRVRRMRIDGFTGEKQVVFLESIAAGFTVVEAAARAGISVTTVYNFRNRRAGRAFNIAWEAADRRARRPLADHLRGRAVEGQTDTFRDKGGEIVGTRHRHDNRLAMAVLTRLDKKAEAYKEDERLVTVVAEEFEELLDVIEADGDAEDFIDSRTPPAADYRPQERAPKADEEGVISWVTRHRYDKVDPADIDTSDLDRERIYQWTPDQWVRANHSGFLDREDEEAAADKHRELGDEG
jgi:hypothetical protein